MNRSRWSIGIVLLGFVVCALASCNQRSHEPFALADGERLIFFGDSITQHGLYVSYLEAYLLTRFPDRRFTLLNHGLYGETIAVARVGPPPRPPCALRRFARDVTFWNPRRVVACFGMNDGGYRPFDHERFRAYREGIGSLIDRTRKEAHAALVLVTPPPYDPYRRMVGNIAARDFGYDYPAVDYDQTLERYCRYLLDCRAGDVEIADAHAAMTDHLNRRRVGDVSFALTGDGVHPDPTGHWLLAQTLLLAWRAPAVVAETAIDAGTVRTVYGDARNVVRTGNDLAFTWTTRLPMPIDPRWDRRSLELERVSDRLNRYRLTVLSLPAARYRLFARFPADRAEVVVGDFDRDALAAGLDLTGFASFPTVALAGEVLALLLDRRESEDDQWRASTPAPGEMRAAPRITTGEDSVRTTIRTMCQPREIQVRLVAINGTPNDRAGTQP